MRGAEGATAGADGGVGDDGVELMSMILGAVVGAAVSDRRAPLAGSTSTQQVATRRARKSAVIALIVGAQRS